MSACEVSDHKYSKVRILPRVGHTYHAENETTLPLMWTSQWRRLCRSHFLNGNRAVLSLRSISMFMELGPPTTTFYISLPLFWSVILVQPFLVCNSPLLLGKLKYRGKGLVTPLIFWSNVLLPYILLKSP